ncbi:endonuclease/exonuclease/phosphatase family protein, partial [Trifolium medium]|nr:endonuclease/exonuclease/phosphatase family protein [Trifolium medium]
MEEVKAAVWDCDSYKSPEPNEINFGFIEEFWVDFIDDIMRFITDFHRNGRLTKCGFRVAVKGRQILDGILVANEVVDEA